MENLLSLVKYHIILPYLISLVKTSITLIIISTIARTNQLHIILKRFFFQKLGSKEYLEGEEIINQQNNNTM
jgi:hypothetical protein